MLFNSFKFMAFFPAVCLCYYVIPFGARNIFLLFASYFFYMCWNPKYGILILLSTVITYLSGLLIDRVDRIDPEPRKKMRWKRLFLVLSLVSNLGILFFFKYFQFLIDTMNRLLAYMHIAPVGLYLDVLLPVGISFYTFQALSYTIDVYRGDIYCEKNFFRYALFVSFFPQLVAGPIERSKNLLRQIGQRHPFDGYQVQMGLTRMLYGYFQKMILSDNIAVLVNRVYNNYTEYGSIELITATLFFAIQIYCDFGGYSNIAIGAAQVMGFQLMENFDTPYLSSSVAEFWRRWHISLSTWFRDYLYIPLGGNRKGRVRKYLNLMIVFLVSGLWHGASWHYVVWGGLNGLYQVAGDLLRPARDAVVGTLHIRRDTLSHRLIKMIVTFILINFSWIFFRAWGCGQAIEIVQQIFTRWDPWVLFDGSLFELGLGSGQFYMILAGILLLFAADLLRYRKYKIYEIFMQQSIFFRWAVWFVFIFGIMIFGSYGPGYSASQFIYFQF